MIKASSLVERTKDSKEVFKGELLHVFYDKALLPDGEHSTREWIKHPGACAIVPIFDNEDVMLVQQFRYPMKQIFLEVPAGKIDNQEEPFVTAGREMAEETGLRAQEMHYIGHFYPAIGYADEVIHIFAAMGLEAKNQQTDLDEFVINERIPLAEAMAMIESGMINDGKTMVCLTRVNNWLKSRA